MGDTLRYAEQMDLLAMQPRGDLTSTGYALANPGQEYLVLQADATAEPFTLMLADGSYKGEWYDVGSRRTQPAEPLTVTKDERHLFQAPFVDAGPAVLYLRRTGS